VTGTPDTPYLYRLKFNESVVPDHPLAYRVGDRDVATIDASYHTNTSGRYLEDWNEFEVPGEIGFMNADFFRAGTERTEYVAPAAQQSLWDEAVSDDETGTFVDEQQTFAPTRSTAVWGAPVFGFGNIPLPFGDRLVCNALCRQGDLFYLDPGLHDGFGRQAQVADTVGARLTADGQDLPLQFVDGFIPAFPTAGPAPATYRLTLVWAPANPADVGGMTRSETSWTFRSGQVGPQEGPSDNVTCIESILGSTDPCRSEPLLYLSYGGLDLDLDNDAGHGPTRLTIGVRHQLGAVAPPPVRTLTAAVSFDDGATWTPVDARRGGGSSWTVRIDNPPPPKRSGDVSLRAVATDADGNSVTQTITHLYGVTR